MNKKASLLFENKKYIKTCWVLEQNIMDRWDKDLSVPKWWNEESLEGKKENDHDPKHTTSFVKHGDIGSLTHSETVLLVFIGDEEANCNNRMNSEVHRSILEIFTSKQVLPNASVDGFLPLPEMLLKIMDKNSEHKT